MKYSHSKIAWISTAVLTTLLFGAIGNAQAQTQSSNRGRLWVISNDGASISVFDRATSTELKNFNVNQWYSTVNSCSWNVLIPKYGRGIAFDPTDGNIWFTIQLGNGDMDGGVLGDGLIHKMPSMGGPDVAQIPDPTALPNSGFSSCGGIGALDYDADENVLYAISYWQKSDGTGFPWIFKLDASNGNVLNSFPYRWISSHNSTLAIVHPAGLGSEKALKVNDAVIDINTGALLAGHYSDGFAGSNGIDEDEVTGQIVNAPFVPSARKDISVEDGHRCDCDLIAKPPTQTVSSDWPDPDNRLNWSMQVEVSDTDGLVVRDVKLGQRYMAEKISVPYYTLETTDVSIPRAELKPDGSNDLTASSRLINYQVFSDDQKLIIQATYLIDRIPSTSKSCLHVTQRYEFYKSVPGDQCEPSGTLPCSRWKPTVKYKFFGQGETLTSINIAQRNHFRVNGFEANSVGLFRDCNYNPLICIPLAGGLVFRDKFNPLDIEYGSNLIRQGQDAGTWDNFHQTFNNDVEEPATFPHFFSPGCPECLHFHWRWGATNGAAFGDGKPLIAVGSKQDVDMAVVRSHLFSSEQDPNDYHDLFSQPESIRTLRYGSAGHPFFGPDDVVFWYSSTGHHQQQDTFSPIKGGFFNPSYEGVTAPITEAPLPGGAAPSSGTKTSAAVSVNTAFQDLPESVAFGDLYETGPTTFEAVAPSTVGPLPNGYVVYGDDSYDIKTESTVSGPHVVTFAVPSVTDETLFGNLRILHVEPDSFDPAKARLIDRTVLSPDAPAPAFANRKISARIDGLGTFLIATFSPQPPNNDLADLAVSVSHSPSSPSAGSDLTYTVNVSNNGPQTANEVMLKDGQAPEVSFVLVTSSQGSCRELDGSVLCDLNSLASGASASITVVVQPVDGSVSFPPGGKTINNVAVVKANEGDSNLANNSFTESTTVLPDPNAAPTVSINSPATGALFVGPTNVTISATASDGDGSISKIEFFDKGELIGTGAATGSNQYSLEWIDVVFGEHSIVAVATDNAGKTNLSKATNIIVNGLANVNITSPGAGQIFNRPANIGVTANASYSGGNISKVEFLANGSLIGAGNATGPGQYAITWNNAPGGSYALSAVATDETGVTTVSSPISIIVNDYPEVSLTSPTGTQQYNAPASIDLAGSANDIDGSISRVTFYANGSPICSRATLGAFQYVCTWGNVAAGSYMLTAVATDNSGGATTSNSVNITVNAPPTVSLTGPASGTQYVTPANIVITSTASDSDGSVSRVDVNANGSFIGTATAVGQNQYTFTWTNAKAGDYTLTTVATDNRGATTTSNSTSIKVLSPALFVVGSTTLSSSDSVVKTRLEALNYIVTVKNGTNAAAVDATGKAIVVISSTVTPNSVGTKFRTVAVPVVLWESGLYANMGITNTTNTNSGTTAKQMQVKIINPSHPLADGLLGQGSVTTTSGTLSWGKPNANAVSVATIVNDTTKIVIFGYEQGAVMPGLTAPARRVGLFMHDTTAANFNASGQRFFDAAIKWATGRI